MEHSAAPNPALIFDTINAYQRSAALKTAIELNLFSHVAQGSHDAASIALAAGASERGIRILCDFLVVAGLLTKENGGYGLTLEARLFLDRGSPAYFGNTVHFLLDPRLISPFLKLPEVVRTGTSTLPEGGIVSPDNAIWVTFAREMSSMIFLAAEEMAKIVPGTGPEEILDVAAGHGLFGIMMARQNPEARVTALDWPNVLAVATENAKKHGVAERHRLLPGSAFETEFGGPYDVVLMTNFFHHFDQPTCEGLMAKAFAALKPGGRCVTLDFVPNDDRVSPPVPATFAMMMLATTPAGDVYTFREYEAMFRAAGFARSEIHGLRTGPQSVIVSTKA